MNGFLLPGIFLKEPVAPSAIERLETAKNNILGLVTVYKIQAVDRQELPSRLRQTPFFARLLFIGISR